MRESLTDRLQQALRWRDDVEEGEMIQAPGYRKDYMQFQEGISSKELDAICDVANAFYKAMDSKLRLGWSAGELLPYYEPQRKLL